MPNKRSVVRESVRAALGIVGIAVAAASVMAATWLPLPEHTQPAPSVTVSPTPTKQQRVCPGPLLALGEDSAAATQASSFGSAEQVSGAGAGEPDPKVTSIKPADDGSGERYGTPTRLSVPAGPDAKTPPLISGAQSQTADLEDLTGFAAAGCGEATGDSWLVAGATNLGKTSLVLLSNPTAVVATVDLTVYSAQGIVKAPGASGIIVDAGTQRVIPLAGLAPDLPATVVHVQSRGGRILASMQQSIVRGLEPGGVELAQATARPATHQVIPGVSVTALAALRAGNSSESYSDALPAVRVLVPGTAAAKVTVGAVSEASTSAGTSTAATVQPGVPTEIPLENLRDGNYTLTIDADQPVVVAARTSTTGAGGRDFSWFEASEAFTGDFLVSVAKGPGALLHLANTSNADAALDLSLDHGSAKSVKVPAGSAVNVTVGSGRVYAVTGAEGIVASMSYTGNGAASAYALVPPGPLAKPITVYSR